MLENRIQTNLNAWNSWNFLSIAIPPPYASRSPHWTDSVAKRVKWKIKRNQRIFNEHFSAGCKDTKTTHNKLLLCTDFSEWRQNTFAHLFPLLPTFLYCAVDESDFDSPICAYFISYVQRRCRLSGVLFMCYLPGSTYISPPVFRWESLIISLTVLNCVEDAFNC